MINERITTVENIYIMNNVLPRVWKKRDIEFNGNYATLYHWKKQKDAHTYAYVYDRVIMANERVNDDDTQIHINMMLDLRGNWEEIPHEIRYSNTDIQEFSKLMFYTPKKYLYVVAQTKIFAFDLNKIELIKDKENGGYVFNTSDAKQINIKNLREKFIKDNEHLLDAPNYELTRYVSQLINK